MMSMFQKLKKLDDSREVLSQVKFHLQSQAKPNTPKCNPEYYTELAKKVEALELAVNNVLYGDY